MCEVYCRRLFLQFTFPANVCSARPGKVRPGQVRLFGLTCPPKQPQEHSRGTSAGKVNCRKCGRDRPAKGCITASAVAKGCQMRVDNVCGPALAGVDIAAKDRLSRRQQVICAANDADGENGRCPAASQPRRQRASVATCPCRGCHRQTSQESEIRVIWPESL